MELLRDRVFVLALCLLAGVSVVITGCKSPEQKATELEQQIITAVESRDASTVGTLVDEAMEIHPPFVETQLARAREQLDGGDPESARLWLVHCDTADCVETRAQASGALFDALGQAGVDESSIPDLFTYAFEAAQESEGCGLLAVFNYVRESKEADRELPTALVDELETRIEARRPPESSDDLSSTLSGTNLFAEGGKAASGVETCAEMSDAVLRLEGQYQGVYAMMGRSTGGPSSGFNSSTKRQNIAIYNILRTKLDRLQEPDPETPSSEGEAAQDE